MLFLGTEKYPEEDEYESFLSRYGGFCNAYTDMEDTNYFFSVTTENTDPSQTTPALTGALDRLAQFFISPTFGSDAVERELKAIDSEYRNGITSDAWRGYQLLKSLCDQRHPFHKFGCGNYETLSSKGTETLLEELRLFWERYYRTYNLRLSVVGHGSLDALQKSVEETFGQIPISEGSPRRLMNTEGQLFQREHAVYGIPVFGPEQMGFMYHTKPLTETRSVKVMFAVPPFDDPTMRKSKPYRVLSHILGHESPHSLHALLNEEGYLTDLTSGASVDCSDFALFSISVALTEKGMNEYERVLDLVFQWITLLKAHVELLPEYHDELHRIAMMNFRFRENGDPTDFCSSAAELLFDENDSPGEFLTSGSSSEEYDPFVADEFLKRLTPENCIVQVTSSDFDDTSDAWESEV